MGIGYIYAVKCRNRTYCKFIKLTNLAIKQKSFQSFEFLLLHEGIQMSENINKSDLVDIRDVKVDKSLPKNERIAQFVRQIKDPYHFKCGKFTITAKYTNNGPTIEDCLQRIMT